MTQPRDIDQSLTLRFVTNGGLSTHRPVHISLFDDRNTQPFSAGLAVIRSPRHLFGPQSTNRPVGQWVDVA